MVLRDHLLELAHQFALRRNITLWRVGALAARDGKFFLRLKKGGNCTIKTYQRVLAWFSENWPQKTPWPADIPKFSKRNAF